MYYLHTATKIATTIANERNSRSLEILKTHFQEDVLEVQDPWNTDDRFEKLLQLLPDRNLNESLRRKWDASPGRASTSKWADIDAVAKTGASKSLDARALLEAKQDIVLEYTYPRLDIEVSKKLNHLLKSPFVVHPGTGRVCVPIDTKALDGFDPLAVPTVQSLLGEIDSWKDECEKKEDDADADADANVNADADADAEAEAEADNAKSKGVPDWEKTSLKPYVDYFRLFVNGIIRDEKDARVKRERDDSSMEF